MWTKVSDEKTTQKSIIELVFQLETEFLKNHPRAGSYIAMEKIVNKLSFIFSTIVAITVSILAIAPIIVASLKKVEPELPLLNKSM